MQMQIRKSDVLNLGCGQDVRPNEWNVDIVELDGVDEVVDLDEYPWPWESSSWERIRTRHVLEHLDSPMQAVDEIARVLAPGGEWTLVYPIGHTRFEDPTHQNFWNYNTAEALVGRREHSHEHSSGFRLIDRSVDWTVDSDLWRYYVRYKLRKTGPGPWLSQIPTLSGEVKATYRER